MKLSLMITCLGDVIRPEAGKAAVRILRRLGHTVDFPEAQTCCGQPMFNSGYAELAREGCLTTEEGSGHFVADAERLHRLAAERRTRLEQLCEQFLSCASAQGFTVEEALRAAHALTQRSTPCPHK